MRREIEVEGTPEEVWEELTENRDAWLDEPDREIVVETEDEPRRLVWWWWEGDQPATRVEFLVVAAPAGARVIVTESAPARIPLTALAMRFQLVCA
ncbi:MAG: hypothetical protein QOF76_1384 [Solirubrobacteraceae bacterium]|jgi:hypothetical protein|nr:hypothetical protein [Solirubrobacteraceae bacterium]